MHKYLLVFALAVPLCSYCQSYADSPFYKPISATPSSARVEGWSHGSTKANGIVIDLSESDPSPSHDFDEIRGWSVRSSVDRKSGSAISITTLPLGAGKIAVIHYLLLTRTDLTPNAELVQ